MARIRSLGYTVEVGNNVFKNLNSFLKKRNYSMYFILCDENTLYNCLPQLVSACPALADAEIMELESGEASKCLDVCNHVWLTLAGNKADRNALVINLGGGVVSDIGGFCASVYKRGIDFINVPTSLLAMADASIGGKTGIDLEDLKNMIGTFAQPKGVFIYPPFLRTLPLRHHHNGMAEIYKIALASDGDFWLQLVSGILHSKSEKIIIRALQLKNDIVCKDPLDKAGRKILNFGHTLGHAIETEYLQSASPLLHGEAVWIGMLLESHIAMQKRLITQKLFREICKGLTGALVSTKLLDASSLLSHIGNDKKGSHQKMLFSLPVKIGRCAYDCRVSENQVKKAIAYYNTLER